MGNNLSSSYKGYNCVLFSRSQNNDGEWITQNAGTFHVLPYIICLHNFWIAQHAVIRNNFFNGCPNLYIPSPDHQHIVCILSNHNFFKYLWLFLEAAWWRHQMATFSALLALCTGNLPPVTGEIPSQRPVTRSLDASFDLRLNKRLRNNCQAGDFRRHRAHYDLVIEGVKLRAVNRVEPRDHGVPLK